MSASAINPKTEEGVARLREAAIFGDAETVHALIKAGVDVNVKDGNGKIPLHHAADFGYAEITQALGASRRRRRRQRQRQKRRNAVAHGGFLGMR